MATWLLNYLSNFSKSAENRSLVRFDDYPAADKINGQEKEEYEIEQEHDK